MCLNLLIVSLNAHHSGIAYHIEQQCNKGHQQIKVIKIFKVIYNNIYESAVNVLQNKSFYDMNLTFKVT